MQSRTMIRVREYLNSALGLQHDSSNVPRDCECNSKSFGDPRVIDILFLKILFIESIVILC